jgi:hypothetical protein
VELTFPSRLAWMHDILKIIETLVLEAGAADLARDMTLCGNPLSRSLLGKSGHGLLQRICRLLTQSGHCL